MKELPSRLARDLFMLIPLLLRRTPSDNNNIINLDLTVIHQSFAKGHPSSSKFYLRRALLIFPLPLVLQQARPPSSTTIASLTSSLHGAHHEFSNLYIQSTWWRISSLPRWRCSSCPIAQANLSSSLAHIAPALNVLPQTAVRGSRGKAQLKDEERRKQNRLSCRASVATR